MKKLSIFYFMILSLQAFAFEDMPVHQHYVKIIGVLPEPHVDFLLEIELDEETDDALRVNIEVGGKQVFFPKSELEKLKDLNLSDLSIKHGMHRNPEQPAKPIYDFFEDYIVIRLTSGNRKRSEREVNGKKEYEWSYDPVTIMFIPGKPARVGAAGFDLSEVEWEPDA
ncbi:hypothetical protein [Microbulbifer halophilus]|uniref:Uncharacterized protein n=1 Tax=Microbulbifer halophilus TaxID=453963 RepID=A0ABW5EKK5_9GAMM|nr:hypothetical protein [Microbulbifer halophilus]MCW8127836.1 hypothetical protein [Microbulbifer halophilus]